MRAVMLEVPESILVERRMRGADRWDEMWEGELHMVPPPFTRHQDVSGRMFRILAPVAESRGMLAFIETGLFRVGVDDDYRVPDQTYARPELRRERGIEGPAALVVEILSPSDESYRKLDWYGSLGVEEALIVDPETRAAELFSNQAGRMVAVPPTEGAVVIASLGVTVETVDSRLRLTWDGGAADI